MQKIAIVGHKNPDTDSIVSAIAAQEYLTQVLKKEALAFRAGELNNETKFILEYFGVQVPEMMSGSGQADVFALVDHNEISQIASGIEFEKVEYVFDHHKLLISTEKPIFCRCEPLGSTSSLFAKLFEESGVKPSESVAKLLLAGLLSDTLNLTSPTTTQEDKLLVEKLNDIANIEIAAFCAEMFKAKSSLEGVGVAEIISLDYKVFEMGNKKIGIGTWETTDTQAINEKNAEIKQQLILKKEEDGLSMIFFMVVDIIKQNCFLYVVGQEEKQVAKRVFGGEETEDIIELAGVVSRKKQIVPPLTEYLSK